MVCTRFCTFVGYLKLYKMMEQEQWQEASRDAVRALEHERDRCVERVTEIDGYLQVMNGVSGVLAENERLKEELESMRAAYEGEKALRLKLEMELNEMKKLAAGVANKTSQEVLIKAISTFVNKSKQKRIEKRAMVKSIVLEMAMINGLTLPDDLMQTIDALDDERVEHKEIIMNQPTFEGPMYDVHNNEKVNLSR